MNWDVLFDPLFWTPFITGFLLAVILPVLGVLLRLKDEWLAALGLAHLAGASGLVGLAVGIPVVLGAPLGALAGALIKSFGRFSGNTIYALMILIGWAATLLIAANTTLGSAMGHALVEGQLYFADNTHLVSAYIYALSSILLLQWMAPVLVSARLFPGHAFSLHHSVRKWHIGFNLLVALGMALGTGTLGLMAAFALVFIPAWVAFRLASRWRVCLAIGTGIGLISYILAFAIALILDQPFGPTLVAVLIMQAIMALIFWPAPTQQPKSPTSSV